MTVGVSTTAVVPLEVLSPQQLGVELPTFSMVRFTKKQTLKQNNKHSSPSAGRPRRPCLQRRRRRRNRRQRRTDRPALAHTRPPPSARPPRPTRKGGVAPCARQRCPAIKRRGNTKPEQRSTGWSRSSTSMHGRVVRLKTKRRRCRCRKRGQGVKPKHIRVQRKLGREHAPFAIFSYSPPAKRQPISINKTRQRAEHRPQNAHNHTHRERSNKP